MAQRQKSLVAMLKPPSTSGELASWITLSQPIIDKVQMQVQEKQEQWRQQQQQKEQQQQFDAEWNQWSARHDMQPKPCRTNEGPHISVGTMPK